MASVFDSKDLKVVQQLNDELKKLKGTFVDTSEAILSAQKEMSKQARTQDELKQKSRELNTVTKELIKLDNQMVITEAKMTEEYKQVSLALYKKQAASKKMHDELKKEAGLIKEHTSFTQKMTGSIKDAIGKFTLMAGAVGLSVGAIRNFLTYVKNSSQFMSDQWAITMAQGKAALDTFSKALSAPEGFHNFISNLKNALTEAKKYAKELDELGELNRELKIQQEKARKALAEEAKIFRSSTASVDEKIAATEKYIKIQRDLATTKENITKRAYENEISNLIKGTELTREQAKAYIENYSALDPMVKKAIEFLETQRDLQPKAFTLNPIKGWSNGIRTAMDLVTGETGKGFERMREIAAEFEKAGQSSEEAFKLAAGYLSFSEEAMNRTGAAAEAYFGSLGEFDEKTLRATLAQDRANAAIDKRTKSEGELVDDRVKGIEYVTLKRIEATEIETNLAKDADKFIRKLEENAALRKEEQAAKDEEAAKELLQKKKEAEKELFQVGIESANQLFQLRGDFIDQEISDIQRKRDEEIETAERAGKDSSKIKKKYAKEENDLRKKQAINTKLQAIFNIAINTAELIMKLGAQLGVAAIPFQIAAAALGATQAGIVIAQPIPKFRHGTSNAPGGAAVVSESGQELGILPSGEKFLTPEHESVLNLPKGTKIFPAYSKETKEAKEGYIDTMKIVNELQLTRKAITNQPRKTTTINQRGLESFVQHNNMRIKLLNDRFR